MLIATEGLDGAGKSTVRDKLIEQFSSETVVTTTEPYDTEWLGQQVRNLISDNSNHPLTVFFTFLADHIYHYASVVRPELEQGNIVISDRYIDSRYAYQGYGIDEYVNGDTLKYIKTIHESELLIDSDNQVVKAMLETAREEMPTEVHRTTPRLGRYMYGLSRNLSELPTDENDTITLTDPHMDLPGLRYVKAEETTWTKLPDRTVFINISVDTSIKRQGKETEVFENREFLSYVRENYLELVDSDPDRFIVIDGEQSKEKVLSDVIHELSKIQ